VNFINQIHNNSENIDISWTFQYYSNSNNIKDNNYDGFFIIGVESFEKYNKKNNLITIYTKLTECGNVLEWKFPLDKLYIGNFFYEINNEELKIDTDIEGFEIPQKFLDNLNEIFFDKYYSKKICETEIIIESLIVISCYNDKFTENDIQNFPEINFYKYKIGFNFSFTGKELFYKKDKKYFFRMVANLKNNEKDYKVGRMFLEKYQVIFNSDTKSMSFYKNNINRNNIYESDSINIIIYFFIGFLFLEIGIFFGRQYCWTKFFILFFLVYGLKNVLYS